LDLELECDQPAARHFSDCGISAREAGLGYFRFNGKSYHCIGNAQLLSDNQVNEKIVSKPH
jgi:hypothetical protein